MAAPFFCTTTILTSDLLKLGYPHVDDKKLLATEGAPRIVLLTWLAEQVDPTASLKDEDAVADFWQALGVHCNERTPAAHRVPFTSGNRPRDRASAFVYLRAAVDIVLAVRRLRGEDNLIGWLARAEDEASTPGSVSASDDEAECVNEFDGEMMGQLDALIANRHTLFPTSVKLLSGSTRARPKRMPLAQRVAPSANILNAMRAPGAAGSPRVRMDGKKAGAKKAGGRKADTDGMIPPREQVLERLRELRRELADYTKALNAGGKTEARTSDGLGTVEESAGVIEGIVQSARAVTRRARQLDAIVTETDALRRATGRSIQRDSAMEEGLGREISDCCILVKDAEAVALRTARVRKAADGLLRGGHALQSLPDSAAVRSVVLQQVRAEGHLH